LLRSLYQSQNAGRFQILDVNAIGEIRDDLAEHVTHEIQVSDDKIVALLAF
jgi:hypothetical protein